MTLEEMEKRLKAIEDAEAIKNMHNDYLFYLNNRQWPEMAECFTEDATVNIHDLVRGKKAILKLFTDVIARKNAGKGRDAHFAVQPVVEVDGDKAKSHWLIYIFIADPATGNAQRFIQGRYDCEYARVDGRWKFSALTYTSPWPD
ncbi:MAG: nuclear transport factor 2 family protein [Chloroflexota bacterium]